MEVETSRVSYRIRKYWEGFHAVFKHISAKFGSLAASAAAALALIAAPATLNVPEAKADVCPAVVVVAARGSGQNSQIYPTWYSAGAPYASNGWEGETIRAMLRTVESRYQATHGGASVMNSVYVLGLTPQDYPATYPAYTVPDVGLPQGIGDVIAILAQYASPVLNTAISAANQFNYSMQTGRKGVMNAINGYERASGCRPKYILTGFSQGAMVLAEHEKELAARGQLAGAVYMGNPMTRKGDPTTVGNTATEGGPLGWTPLNTVPAAGTPNRINYCLPQDGVCDTSVGTLMASRGNGGNHGRYFQWWSQWDNQVADAVGRWIDQAR